MKKVEINTPVTNKIAKTPVVMQLETLECGAACLAMILAYYNKWIPLEQVRVDCGVSRDGSNAKNIYKAANNYGLTVEAYKFELEDIKKEATFPCIIHWNFNHFVVLNGFKGNYAYINDPGRGDVKVLMDEFDRSFTGVCLMFKPSENFVPSGKKPSSFDYINKKIKDLGPMIIFGVALSVLTAIIGIITPVFNKLYYDNILPNPGSSWAKAFLVIYFVFGLMTVLLSLVQTMFNLRARGKMDVVGSSKFMWKVLRLPLRFFSQRMSGDIISRKNSNAQISSEIVDVIAPLFMNAVMMVIYFAIMIEYSWILTVVALATSLINLIFSRLITRKRMNATRIVLRDTAKAESYAVSGIQNIESIKSSGAEDGYFARWAGYEASASEANIKHEKITTYYGIAPKIISTICTSIILALGIYLTIKGEFTLGMITAFSGYLTSFLSPINNFINTGRELQEMQTSIERLNDVMNYPDDSIFDGTEDLPIEEYKKLSGEIEIKNVTFGYSPLNDPLIKDFSLSIPRGSSVAIVGTSGCGKSTLSKLISGIEKPWSGEILFDGKTINQINRSIFTSSVSVVDQDVIIFEDTIRNNIKMFDSTIEDFEMIMAANDAHLHEDIMQRVGGYDYVLSEGGKDFSGGQKQRLEIARVLAQDPTICILDEATSALDAKTEHEVVKAINDRNITTIVIAHRLSTIRNCDQIIVLDHGNVMEKGTHDELIAKKGYYFNLVSAD